MGLLLLPVFTPRISQISYILVDGADCAVVDPRRDVDIYIDTVHSMGLRITHVLETHLHADFISGHMDLADRTGATVYGPERATAAFEHVAVNEGDEIAVGDSILQVVETPGHTPEHVSYVLIDRSRGEQPAAVFSGDALFVGDVGRPDLFPGQARRLGRRLYHSLHRKLMNLPDYCELYPLHAAGSLCGRAISSKRSSTIGYERLFNAALRIADADDFVESLITDMPPAPDYFSICTKLNAQGPVLLSSLPSPRPMSAAEFRDAANNDHAIVLDVRPYESFGAQHISGSYSIDLEANFPVLAGWVIPPDRDILLVGSSYDQVKEAVDWLRRVGLDRITGLLDGGMSAWALAGLPTSHVRQLSAIEFHEMLTTDKELRVLDVRPALEYAGGHIRRAVNIPVADLRTRYTELDPSRPLAVVCPGGSRATMGISLLMQRGFDRLMNVAGGMTGYAAAGFSNDL